MTKTAQKPYPLGLHKRTIYSPYKGVAPSLGHFLLLFIAKHMITYIALLYLQHDTILNLLTIHYIIVVAVAVAVVVVVGGVAVVVHS